MSISGRFSCFGKYRVPQQRCCWPCILHVLSSHKEYFLHRIPYCARIRVIQQKLWYTLRLQREMLLEKALLGGRLGGLCGGDGKELPTVRFRVDLYHATNAAGATIPSGLLQFWSPHLLEVPSSTSKKLGVLDMGRSLPSPCVQGSKSDLSLPTRKKKMSHLPGNGELPSTHHRLRNVSRS